MLLAALAAFFLLNTSLVSTRDCTEILLQENQSQDPRELYTQRLLQDYLDSSPYKPFYNNSLLNDNASIISQEDEILPMLESLRPDITITIVTVNSSNVSEEMVNYLMLASNTSILFLANSTQLLAFYRDNESAMTAYFAMQHAYGKTSEQKILSALHSLQERRFLERNSQGILLLLLALLSTPFILLLGLTPQTGMPLKILSCLASFILASSFTPSAFLPGEPLFAKPGPPEPVKAASAQSTEHPAKISLQSSAATYYVATNGVDNAGCGSSASPCATVQYVLNNKVAAGDTIKVKAGTYSGWLGNFWADINTPAKHNNLTITADDPNNRPLIQGTEAKWGLIWIRNSVS